MSKYPASDIAPSAPVVRSHDGTPSGPDEPAGGARESTAPVPGEQTLELARPWRNPPDRVQLRVRYRQTSARAGGLVAELDGPTGSMRVPLQAPLALAPAQVDKPWGRELWLTGIEARGESAVRVEDALLPLSQYLALAPAYLTGAAPMILLKILDPTPRPLLGDLYFEVHERKQEVYVVTHVDPAAWPDGRGAIRFGMNQTVRREYGDDPAFRAAYLEAVRRYEQVRRAIDAGDAGSAVQEAELRGAMERFTHLRRLAVGDVVVVPAWLPHSLQHGVRVIELQTPSYERHVISFAQPMQTQHHWDSEHAIAHMSVEQAPDPIDEAVAPGVSRIAAFDDFSVWRATLEPGASLPLPDHPGYLLCTGVAGQVRLDTLELGPEQAALVPGCVLRDATLRHTRGTLHNHGDCPAVVLLAAADL
ncbi:MAG: hypothetical protein R3E86_21080 [Pseudomonadales bacterium]